LRSSNDFDPTLSSGTGSGGTGIGSAIRSGGRGGGGVFVIGGGGGSGRATGAGFLEQALAVIAVTTTAIVSRLANLVICFPGARK
jgi:hypothetical protein